MSLLLPAADPMPRDRTAAKVRFNFPDGLRAIAALWVMGQHLWVDHHTPALFHALPAGFNRLFFQFGYLGVAIFFVLSGFFMAHALRQQVITRGQLGRLYWQRFLRLSPAYYVAILLAISCSALTAGFSGHTFSPPHWSTLLKHFTYLQGLIPSETINGVYWTLCIEIQFYLIFCLLLGGAQWLQRRQPENSTQTSPENSIPQNSTLDPGRSWIWPTALLTATLWPAHLWPSSSFLEATFIPYGYSCLLGALVYWTWQKQQPGLILSGYFSLLALITLYNHSLFTGMVLITALSLNLAGNHGGLAQWLNWAWLQRMGQLSYAFYLVHEPLLKVLFPIEHRLFGQHLWVDLSGVVVNFGICVGIAELLHRYVEQPGIRWSRKWVRRLAPQQ